MNVFQTLMIAIMAGAMISACSNESRKAGSTEPGSVAGGDTAASDDRGSRDPASVPDNEPTSTDLDGIIEDLSEEELEDFLNDLEPAAGGEPIEIGAHAYEFLDTSTNFGAAFQTLPGLQTYILIPEQTDASDLYSALFESVDSLGDVLESTEFTLNQINVFFLPIKADFALRTPGMGPANVELVAEAYDHDWARRALDDICGFVSDSDACEGLSGGPYLVSSLKPLKPEPQSDDEEVLGDYEGPSEFVLLDIGALQDRTSWKYVIDAYKAAVFEADTLSGINSATNETIGASQLLSAMNESLTQSGSVQFPQQLVMRTLTTAGGCSKNWNCRIVCEP